MTLFDVNDATSKIYDAAGADANIIVGAVIDPNLKDVVRVTVIATGFGSGTSVNDTTEEVRQQPAVVTDLFGNPVKQSSVASKAPASPGNGGNGNKTKQLVFAEGDNLEVPAFIRRQMEEL